MKHLFITCLFSFTGIYSFAQMKDDTTRVKVGSTIIMIIENESDSLNDDFDPRDGHRGKDSYDSNDFANWAGFSIGINGLVNRDRSMNLPDEYDYMDIDYTKSLNVNLNIMEKRFEIGTKHIGITTGLGFEFSRYEFKNNTMLLSNSDSTWGRIDSIPTYDKNFLKTTYLQVPLLLDFTTASMESKSVSLAAGIVGGYRIGTKMKVKYHTDGSKYKDRVKDDFNVNPFKLAATARLSLGNTTLFATYSLTSLFEKGKGPEAYPVSVGLSIIPF